MKLYFILLTFFLCWPFSAVGQEKGAINVMVTGANPNQGKVVLSLFNSPNNFLKEPLVLVSKKIDSKGNVEFYLPDLLDAYYAVSVYYDQDENDELNTNFWGIPAESVGFSNNAKGSFGPPTFEQTKFKRLQNTIIEIKLVNVAE